jgi:hypothetical protein
MCASKNVHHDELQFWSVFIRINAMAASKVYSSSRTKYGGAFHSIPFRGTSHPSPFGLAKNLFCPVRQLVDEYLSNLAELPAPKNPNRQAREPAQR